MKITPDGSLEGNNSDIFPVSELDLAVRDVLVDILDLVKPDVANALRLYKVKGDQMVLETLTSLKNLLGDGETRPWVTIQGETLPLRAIHRLSRSFSFTADDELKFILELNRESEASGPGTLSLLALRFEYDAEDERDAEYEWLRGQMKKNGANFLE